MADNNKSDNYVNLINQTTTTDDVDDSVEDLLLRFYGKDRTKDFASLGYKNPAELRKAALERAKNLYT